MTQDSGSAMPTLSCWPACRKTCFFNADGAWPSHFRFFGFEVEQNPSIIPPFATETAHTERVCRDAVAPELK